MGVRITILFEKLQKQTANKLHHGGKGGREVLRSVGGYHGGGPPGRNHRCMYSCVYKHKCKYDCICKYIYIYTRMHKCEHNYEHEYVHTLQTKLTCRNKQRKNEDILIYTYTYTYVHIEFRSKPQCVRDRLHRPGKSASRSRPRSSTPRAC